MNEEQRSNATRRVSAGRWLAGFLTAFALLVALGAAALVFGGVGPSAAVSAGPPMQMDMRLTLDEGEVLEFEVASFQIGLAQLGDPGVGGKVNIQDMSVTKWLDDDSPKLHKACCLGNHYPEALLTVRKAGGDALEYLKIQMNDVQIADYNVGGTGDDTVPMESISLNFGHIEYTYTSQDRKNPEKTAVGYDCDALRECTRR